ncbi:MAG: N-formylglutamate amidohydrolase [Planctomycetota bacterium]
MDGPIWQFQLGDGPLVAAAIHDGGVIRAELRDLLALGDDARRYEEDRYTSRWTSIAPTRIVAYRSRFEMDLNRPRPKAVYLEPEDAWGLHVWKRRPPKELVDRSLAQYDAFYEHVRFLLEGLVAQFGRLVVFDLHTYNHRRAGRDEPPADPQENPDVNLGTGTMDRRRWAPLVDRFLADLSGFDFLGRRLDARENVKFGGGEFSRWIHQEFPETVCSLAVEVKKFFINEWTGELDQARHAAVGQALASAAQGALDELKKL